MPHDPTRDLARNDPEPTVRPAGAEARERAEGADEMLVPPTNVGGDTPTPLGLDSGGVEPGGEEDLENLPEPEPPEPPEVGAVHARDLERGRS